MEEIKITNRNNKIKVYIDGERVYPPTKPKEYKNITLRDLLFSKIDNKYTYHGVFNTRIIESYENLVIEPGSIVYIKSDIRESFIKCYGKITAIGTKDKPIKFIGMDYGGPAIELIKSKDSHFEYCEFHSMRDLIIRKAREEYLNGIWDGRGDAPYEGGFALNCYKCKNLVVRNCKAYCIDEWSTNPIYEHKCYNTTIKNLKVYYENDEGWKFRETINESRPDKIYGP